MARSRLTDVSDGLVTDSGAVLWSFVKGEQLEYPVTLAFIENALAGYVYEAVVVEADNIANQDDRPVTIKAGGIQTKLNVRVPVLRGTWNAPQAYNRDEVVFYSDRYYRLTIGVARISATTPALDPFWVETAVNIVYLQFPSTLAAAWTIQPTVDHPVYGFFELRVTETANVDFKRTWKPARGMVEVLFSPTDIVADV